MDLTVEATKDIAIECAAECGYWRWGGARLAGEGDQRPILPGQVCCDHSSIYDELVDAGQHELLGIFVSQYNHAATILKRDMAQFAPFN